MARRVLLFFRWTCLILAWAIAVWLVVGIAIQGLSEPEALMSPVGLAVTVGIVALSVGLWLVSRFFKRVLER